MNNQLTDSAPVMKDILLIIREHLKMGYTLSFIEAQVLQQAIDVVVILDDNLSATSGGYAIVPVEPTEDMIIAGFESVPDESFSEEKVWEDYEAMSGCQQAAHRAKLCYAAMLRAAPKVHHKENI